MILLSKAWVFYAKRNDNSSPLYCHPNDTTMSQKLAFSINPKICEYKRKYIHILHLYLVWHYTDILVNYAVRTVNNKYYYNNTCESFKHNNTVTTSVFSDNIFMHVVLVFSQHSWLQSHAMWHHYWSAVCHRSTLHPISKYRNCHMFVFDMVLVTNFGCFS